MAAQQIFSAGTDALRAGYLACIVESGYNKGTISVAKPRLKVSNSVRQHRVISISYSTELRCHGRGRGFEPRRPRYSFDWLTALTCGWRIAISAEITQDSLSRCHSSMRNLA